MIPHTVKREVSTNTASQKEFTIKANSKAFKVLIDSLYRDKIQSVTREIWTNAYDSHCAAGCPERPFDVTFPGTFDPAFTVRDYGVGLSHDEVLNIYTTLFESTKENTNEQVGRLGIGSKTPFSYTDTFTIIAIKYGKKNIYSAILNEEGIPTIHLLHSEDTTEETGVTVSFPVMKGDIPYFQRVSKKISFGFDVKPNVINKTGFIWPSKQEYSSYFDTEFCAKMGCVIYPIDFGLVKEYARNINEKTYKLVDFFSNIGGIIDFPIGSLEHTASRESLSYGRHEPTLPSIINHFEKEFSKYKEAVEKYLDSIDDYDEANIMHHAITYDGYSYYSASNFKDEWKTLPSYSKIPISLDVFSKVYKILISDKDFVNNMKQKYAGFEFVKTKNIEPESLKTTIGGKEVKYPNFKHTSMFQGKTIRSFKDIKTKGFENISLSLKHRTILVCDLENTPCKKAISRINSDDFTVNARTLAKFSSKFDKLSIEYKLILCQSEQDYVKIQNRIKNLNTGLVKLIKLEDISLPPVEKKTKEKIELEFRVTQSPTMTIAPRSHNSSFEYLPKLESLNDDESIYYLETKDRKIISNDITESMLPIFSKITGKNIWLVGVSFLPYFKKYYGDVAIPLTSKTMFDSVYDRVVEDMNDPTKKSNIILDLICSEIHKEIQKKYVSISNCYGIFGALKSLKTKDTNSLFYRSINMAKTIFDNVAQQHDNNHGNVLILESNGYDITFIKQECDAYKDSVYNMFEEFKDRYEYLYLLKNIEKDILYGNEITNVVKYAYKVDNIKYEE